MGVAWVRPLLGDNGVSFNSMDALPETINHLM